MATNLTHGASKALFEDQGIISKKFLTSDGSRYAVHGNVKTATYETYHRKNILNIYSSLAYRFSHNLYGTLFFCSGIIALFIAFVLSWTLAYDPAKLGFQYGPITTLIILFFLIGLLTVIGGYILMTDKKNDDA